MEGCLSHENVVMALNIFGMDIWFLKHYSGVDWLQCIAVSVDFLCFDFKTDTNRLLLPASAYSV